LTASHQPSGREWESRSAPTRDDPALEPEWLDRADLDPRARREALADLRRVNTLLFGRGSAVREVVAALAAPRHRDPIGRGLSAPGEPAAAPEARRGGPGAAPAGGTASRSGPPALLLDVAAGSGDVGAAARRAVARRGAHLHVVALDRELQHLLMGRRWGDVDRAVVARAEALPFADRSFDLVLSTLFFHHLDGAGKRVVAAEMLRVCSGAALIVDLRRSRWAAAFVRLVFPLLRIGRIAREDGLVSLARASTLDEWRAFLAAAGACRGAATLRRRFPVRVSVVLRPTPQAPRGDRSGGAASGSPGHR
jgi:hypothetical protein